MSISQETLSSLEPMVEAIASEYGRKGHQYGADREDFRQGLYLWLFDNARKVNEYLDPDLYGEQEAERLLATSLRNEAKDHLADVKAQALGYRTDDLYYYNKGELKALLPSVFDKEKWLHPPQSDGRSAKSYAEGNNWVAILSDVASAYRLLDQEDKDVLFALHAEGYSNKLLAESRGISEALMSYYHDRAIKRLLKHLGGSKPEPDRPSGKNPWRGREAMNNATARAITRRAYDEE